MSKHNYSQNSVSLSSIFNDVVDSIYTITSPSSTSGTSVCDFTYYSFPKVKDNFWQLVEEFTYPTIYTPTYPVSNYYVDEDMNSIIEIAVSGFSEEEISVKRDDLKLIVEGKQNKDKECKRKYFYRNIAERDFSVSYQGSTKWDFDKLEAKISRGILSIFIPMKEECKPIKQEFKINK